MMDEKVLTSDFLNKAIEVCKELSEIAEKATDGKHRGIVILAAEEVNDNNSMNVIGVSGRAKEITSALYDFATQPQTSEMFNVVSIKKLLKH